jgi:cyclic pyranopterin phosphate synthase
VTRREAVAEGRISMKPETFEKIVNKQVQKGDVLEVARLAAIMAAKRTGETIPLCHPIPLNQVEVRFDLDRQGSAVNITATVKCEGRTGVEMEAMHAVAVAGLTIYDMCKAVDREMMISDIRLVRKSGGKSGTFERAGSAVER